MLAASQNRFFENTLLSDRAPFFALILAFFVSIGLKASILGVGSPYVTIDDYTAYEGGFLVWFGHAPLQRMYLESWLYGLVAFVTYSVRAVSGLYEGGLGVNFAVDAYKDFLANPDPYVQAYRSFILVLDAVTAWFVFLISKHVFGEQRVSWKTILPCVLYLFAYNTVWCNIVARPDSVVAFFATAGTLMYLRSDAGKHFYPLLLSAILYGVAGGMKLHAALFAIIVCIDLIRVNGIRNGLRPATMVAGISFTFFCVSAGSALFDPSRYVKLRFMNYVDDFSPWIDWVDHLIVFARGIGWLVLPLLAFAFFLIYSRSKIKSNSPLLAVWLISVIWVFVFLSIRQLRAYWMLPVLPLFFILATYVVFHMKGAAVRAGLASGLVFLQVLGFFSELNTFRSTDFEETNRWFSENAIDRDVLLFGFDSLTLPKSADANAIISSEMQRRIDKDVSDGLPFVLRRLKNWEEEQILLQIEISSGFNGKTYNVFPQHVISPFELDQALGLKNIDLVVINEKLAIDVVVNAMPKFLEDFELVAETMGPGGGGTGLRYRIFERRLDGAR